MKLPEFCVVVIIMIMFLGFMGFPIAGLSDKTGNYGVTINETTGELINADVESSSLFDKIFSGTGILVILIGGGVVIVGLFAKGYDTSLIILPLVVVTGTLFAGTSWSIIKYVSELNQVWATNVVTLLFMGIGVAFIWSCVSYFAGR